MDEVLIIESILNRLNLNKQTYDPVPDIADTSSLSIDSNTGNVTLGDGIPVAFLQNTGGFDYWNGVDSNSIGGFILKSNFVKKQFINSVSVWLRHQDTNRNYTVRCTLYDITDGVTLSSVNRTGTYTTTFVKYTFTFPTVVKIDTSHELRFFFDTTITTDTRTNIEATTSDVLADSNFVNYNLTENASRDARFEIQWSDLATSGTLIESITVKSIEQWERLKYVVDTTPVGTDIQFDILDTDDNVLLSDVQSGSSLNSIDIKQYKTIKLKATFTGDGTTTPTLFYRALSWIGNSTYT